MELKWDSILEPAQGGVLMGIIVLILVLKGAYSRHKNPSRLPYVNGRRWFEIGNGKARERFNANARKLIASGLEKYPAFYLFTDFEFQLILSPSYSDFLRGEDRLNLSKAVGDDFMAGIPGFEPISFTASDTRVIQNSLRVMTRSLANLVNPLSSESEHALRKNWTDNSEWHQIPLGRSLCHIVGQVESRALLGDDLCQHPEWLNVVEETTVDLFHAARSLRAWPPYLRPLVHWFLPSCQKLRGQIHRADEVLKPLIAKAQTKKSLLSTQYDLDRKTFNTVELFLEAFNNDPSGVGAAQLAITVPSLDGMAEGISNILCDLSPRPDLIKDLRKEIIDVIGSEGLEKSSLPKLELMDSVMKESQRLTPVTYATMNRKALQKVLLPDGTVIPKGTRLMVGSTHQMTSTAWPDGENFDGYRFLKLRKASPKDSSYRYTQTSSNHLGFGHGKQACPGRFFAEHQIKVLLVHILLKYDFVVTEPEEGRTFMIGHHIVPHAGLKIDLRRRKEEISI